MTCPQGPPGALLSCCSCGHRLVTAGWDKHGGDTGGMCRQGQGLGAASPGDKLGGLAPLVPTLAQVGRALDPHAAPRST